MTRAVLLLSMLLLPACYAPAEPAADSCEDLYQRFGAAAAALDDSCQTIADCIAIGGQVEDTCNCTPALTDEAVNRAAYPGSAAADLARRFREQCGDDPDAPNVCDGGPPEIACIDNRCLVSRFASCFDVDAGL